MEIVVLLSPAKSLYIQARYRYSTTSRYRYLPYLTYPILRYGSEMKAALVYFNPCCLCVPLHHVGDLLLVGELVVQLNGVELGLEDGGLGDVVLAQLAVVLQHPPRAVHRRTVPTENN